MAFSISKEITLGSLFIISTIENLGSKEVPLSQSGSGVVGVTILKSPKKDSTNLEKVENLKKLKKCFILLYCCNTFVSHS